MPSRSFFSSASVIVVLPEPERPVYHMTTPFCPITLCRFSLPVRHVWPGLHSMMLDESGRPSILRRWRAAASESEAAVDAAGKGFPATALPTASATMPLMSGSAAALPHGKRRG